MKMIYVCKKCNKQWSDEESTCDARCSCGGELYDTGIPDDEWSRKSSDEKIRLFRAWGIFNSSDSNQASGDTRTISKSYLEHNVGDTIKVISWILGIIGCLISIINGNDFLLAGILFSVFSTILLYAFGELVSRTIVTNRILMQMWEREAKQNI